METDARLNRHFTSKLNLHLQGIQPVSKLVRLNKLAYKALTYQNQK